MNVVIPMPKPEPLTEKGRRGIQIASAREVREMLANHSEQSAELWIKIGQELIRAKRDPETDKPISGAEYKKLFAENARERKNDAKYPFSKQTGDMYIRIAKYFEVNNFNLKSLPSAYPILDILTRLDVAEINKRIKSGDIHSTMTQADARALLPKKETKRKQPSNADVFHDTSIRLAKKLKPKQRLIELLNVIHDLGYTIEDLREVENG